MYSAKLGYDKAIKRINKLIENKHYSEAFVVTVFTIEQTLRRTVHQLIVSTGFTTEMTKKLLSRSGIGMIKDNWNFYDPKNRGLVEIIENDNWNKIITCSRMRNDFAHGSAVYSLEKCKNETEDLLNILDQVKQILYDTYGFSGWERLAVRSKSSLHNDPKVNIR